MSIAAARASQDDTLDPHSSKDRTSTVARVVAVLSVLGPDEPGVSLSEIARRTGLPKATVHRLVHQLVSFDLVDLSPSGVRVGMRLFELGQLARGPRDVRDVAIPHLGDLHEASGHTVHLVVPSAHEVLYVHKIENGRSPSVGSRVGGRMPMHCTAVGKALLAHADPDVRDAVLSTPLHRLTARTIIAPGLLARQLRQIRATGIAEEREESAPGIVCVAAPVLDADGRAVAAVSITGPSASTSTYRMAPAVRTAALGISRSLGPGPVSVDHAVRHRPRSVVACP